VIFARAGIRHFVRMTREHALLLTCACAAILLFSFPSPRSNWAAFNWANDNTDRNDAEIDSALQATATAALGQREGTIIIMDAQSGRVRAVVNSQVAFAQAVMPGSTMKPFTALAALRAGLIDEDSRTVCPGRFTGLSFSMACVHADHLPPFTPSQAIAYSCNYYFATLGQRLGRDRLIETVRQFGFGQPTGIAENDEATGILRPCETGNQARIRSAESAHASQQADCNAREAIGESDHIQVTPVQLLAAYAALVNGGHLYEPRVADSNDFHPVERASINISQQHRMIITEGMAGAVRYGTARSAKLDSLPLYILGKTGTALPAKGFRTNGWFVGLAGASQNSRETDPSKIDLAVLVFLSRAHGAEAAVLARPIFETYAKETNGAQRNDAEERKRSAEVKPDNSAILNSQSTVKVHLVHDNVTQELSLEDYVLGVMRAEGSMETEPEALKALAIAIRTYALKNLGRHAKDDYDFCSTTHCQRFVLGAANPAMIEAVKATEGQVLLDDRRQLVDSYFGASCGGETANIGTLWGVTPPEYLRGVRDEYCLSGPHASWNDVITRADLLRALQSDTRTNVGSRLDQVIVTKRDETGRAEFITLEGEHRKSVRGWDFKIIVGRVLGWNLLKSSRFEVARSGSNFIFRGSGFGHGLGLCQEGAHVMAARGASYQRILEKYFPRTSVRKEDRVATRLNGNEGWDLNAQNAKDSAEGAEKDLCVPPRNPLRPLRLNAWFDYYTSRVWKADVLISPAAGERPQPPSGEVFIARKPVYKYFAPTGLKTNQKYLTISSEHFRVTYPADVDRRDADQVLTTLETARADFLHRASAAAISIGSIPTLEIRLNESTGDFTSRTGQPWWAAAATKGNRIELQPVGILKRRGVLTTTLRHELAHAVIDAISNSRAPRWLEEGFALYLAGEGSTISRYATKAKPTTDQIEKKLERPSSQQDMRALYAAAYGAVLNLIRNESEASVWKKLAEN
jgi:SpoIID/LytB domain protein